MFLIVGLYNRRSVDVTHRCQPVAIACLDHCIYERVSFVGSGKLYFVACILENDNRRLLQLLHSASAIRRIDFPCEVFVGVSVQRLRNKEPLLSCLCRQVLRRCPREQTQLRTAYAEINVAACSACIMKLPQQCVRLLRLQ